MCYPLPLVAYKHQKKEIASNNALGSIIIATRRLSVSTFLD
jgi:hypothetical protein